jgi:hypothetical protein
LTANAIARLPIFFTRQISHVIRGSVQSRGKLIGFVEMGAGSNLTKKLLTSH